MKFTLLIAMLVAVLLFVSTSSEAGWLVFNEPEFKGKILDIETKQPIEGAVVVVEYKKATMGLGAGSISSIIDIRETLTDKDGNFSFPSYSTVIQPFSWQISTILIIFKPGYASLRLDASHFTGKDINEIKGSWPGLQNLRYRLHGLGIVELPLLKTREERLYSMPSGPLTDIDPKKQRLLIQLINEERGNLNLEDRYKLK